MVKIYKNLQANAAFISADVFGNNAGKAVLRGFAASNAEFARRFNINIKVNRRGLTCTPLFFFQNNLAHNALQHFLAFHLLYLSVYHRLPTVAFTPRFAYTAGPSGGTNLSYRFLLFSHLHSLPFRALPLSLPPRIFVWVLFFKYFLETIKIRTRTPPRLPW